MTFQPGNKVGRQFSAIHQPRHSGRKPALFKQLTTLVDKEVKLELSKEDFNRLQRWLLERTKDELLTICRNPETPVFIMVLILSMLADLKNGKFNTIERIFDRVFGRSVQPTQVNQVIRDEYRVWDFVELDDEDLEKIGEILKKATDK